jgi:hypothetical protein
MKVKPLVLQALFAAILAAGPAAAGFQDGNGLLRLCNGSAGDRLACTAYIQGASDQWNLYRVITKSGQCGPDSLTGAQLRDVVVSYLQQHTGNLISPAAGLVVEAMAAAWKCK